MPEQLIWTPLQLGPVTVRNRIVFSAHLTNYAVDGLPSEQHVAYYAARAAGGNVFVAGTALFHHPGGLATAVAELRAVAESA